MNKCVSVYSLLIEDMYSQNNKVLVHKEKKKF